MLLLKPDSPSTVFPLDGTAYSVTSQLSDGTFIAANGPDSTAELPHLNPKRAYYARIIEFRQDATTNNLPVYTLDGNLSMKLTPSVLAWQLSQFARYPNPAQNEVRVNGSTVSLPRQLTNAQGARTQQGALTPGRTSPMRNQASGTYFRRVRQAWRDSVLRLVKL